MHKRTRHHNRLDEFRRKRGFTSAHVARLLGHKENSTYQDYERSDRLPSLVNALRLGIILRTPIEFLFGELYDDLLTAIRAKEERLSQPTQPTLFERQINSSAL